MVTQRETVVAAGVRVRREDGQVLVVRHRIGVAAGRWSVPFLGVPDDETAEAAATRLLRDVLHLDPGYLQFAETLTIPAADEDVVINVFDAVGWAGEPRFSERDLDDAGWIDPATATADDVVPEVATWLSGVTPGGDPHADLERALIDARGELLAAYEAIPLLARERPLDAGWAPVDVLHHAAAKEAYLADEALRLAGTPGHVWRDFSADQAGAERRVRARPSDSEVRERSVRTHDDTLRLLETLMPEQLAHFAPHPTRGMIPVREQFTAIADHDREHAAQLRAMRATATAQF